MSKTFRIAAAVAAVATPAALLAQSAYRNLPQQDVQKAQTEHAQLLAEFGGAETGARAAYVDSIGRRVATFSGVNPGAFRFTTLNSAVENAFTVPGGYVYITRQLMGLMNDESELAFVLGHEVGHVAANHARARQSAAQRNSIGGILGAVLGSVIGGGVGSAIGQLASQGAQLRTLSFSREQEYQSDRLGVDYMTRAGYDASGSATMLAALGRASALEARVQGQDNRSAPEWASTHPLSENRSRQALTYAQRSGRYGQGVKNRDQLLSQINGLLIDDDPAQGIIEGRQFTHPDLRLQFAVPTGYLMQNGTDAVSIQGSGAKAQFTGGRFNGNLDQFIAEALSSLSGGRQQVQMPQPQRTQVNGIPAAYVTTRANSGGSVVDVSVFAYQWDRDTAYSFIMLTPGGTGIGPFSQMVGSLRRISAGEAAQIRPRVIQVATVRAGDTVQSLASRMAYRNFQVERFVSLNGLNPGARLVPGQRVKLVVYGQRRQG
jgi:predicted Zn-dependent protease